MDVGILGAGNIARAMAYAVNGLGDGYSAYAAASRDGAKAEKFAREHHVKKAYGSYEEMLQDEAVDLVYIATPHSHHFDHMKLCLKYGKPILCEKAFTMNAAQAKEIFSMAEKKRIFLTEAIWTRYMPGREMLKQLLEQGVIGNVSSLQANLGYPMAHRERMKNPSLAGGALLDLGVYPLNFASMVFGNDIEKIEGVCRKQETGVDAQDSITLFYRDGRVAQLFATMLTATNRLGVIHGDKGYIEVTNINNCEKITVFNNDHVCVRELAVPEQINGYEYEVIACREALDKGELECPQMPHAETIQMMEWMDELRRQWEIVFPGE